MKKIILSILIFFTFVNSYNLFSIERNNNNNNNNQCTELPKEIWKSEIVKKFFYPIEKAETLPKLKSAVKEFLKFSLLSKMYNQIANDLANKEFEVNGKKITLKDFYIQRKQELYEKLKIELSKINALFCLDNFNNLDSALLNAISGQDKGYEEIVKLLIQNGANVNVIEDYSGNTPLLIAAKYGSHIERIKLLIKNGADINAQNSFGDTTLSYACLFGHVEILKLLIVNDAKINTKNQKEMTPLMYAAKYNHIEIIELLISKDADINAKNISGSTALDIAIKSGHKEIVKLLEKQK